MFWFYFNGGTLVIRLVSHNTTEHMIQQTTQKTKTPAKMVANGGPDASLLLSDPPEELLFDADIGSSLCLSCTRTALLNLNNKTENQKIVTSFDNSTSKYNENDIINH